MRTLLRVALATLLIAQAAPAQSLPLRWRNIGPHRGGRTKAGTGVPSQPNVFYIGFVNGGVWKSNDYGRVWTPIFDEQPSGSVGAIAVAESNPNVVYVGSGEGIQRPDLTTGDGIYRSDDAGKTWTHLGLRDGQQIPQIIVDPRNPDRIFVAVLGHPYGPNAERGIFRSTDGGRTFEKVLYRNENTGGAEVAFDPSNAQIVYAVLWEARQGPWENGAFRGPNSGLFKSTDGGTTWRQIGTGLPTGAEGLGRIGISVAASQPSRVYAVISAPEARMGIYRSDDGGENFMRVNPDPRLAGRDGDFDEIKVDPKNADVAYVANVMSWKTTDGGKTFKEFRGAPGGDDYQRFWINPVDPRVILLTSDQGAIVTVNGGETWSSWYNQPTGQFYHVNTTYDFPYRVCGGQQESGSACIASRSDGGSITFRNWDRIGVEEYGYVVPDPRHKSVFFGGRITRTDMTTGDVQNVTPTPIRDPQFSRVLRTAPIIFSPVDTRALYFGTNVVWKTTTGGQSWERISPDLTRKDSIVPANVGTYASQTAATARHPGVVYTIAPSYVNARWTWAGSDDGLIHVTRDGGLHWKDVTPPGIRERPWSKISIIDAGRFDSLTAYAAVNTFRLDDLRPHLWVTHDGGGTWKEIVNGIPADGATNVIREDPVRRGLLFAGTEQAVYYSMDDGAHWSNLRQNMPATSIRDLVIKDNDLVVATHGRSFWIMDDISPLRQMRATLGASAQLFRPATAIRWRWVRWPDTPFPPDEPAGENPPDGAIIDYQLPSNVRSVSLEILDSTGSVVRRFSSDDPRERMLDSTNVPSYWIRPEQRLETAAGMHRFVWDLHYPYPKNVELSYPISAVPFNTVKEPRGPWVLPGRYTVRLVADGGAAMTAPLMVRMDPRITTSRAGVVQQFTLSMQLYNEINRDPKRAAALVPLYTMLQQTDAAPSSQLVSAIRRALGSGRR
jgi:photosystem II stability/assembly factor-like uncharacterized protein